ncbi:MAG TPA: hypothetical protein VIL85_01700 [Thermomicrobiales bacterium]
MNDPGAANKCVDDFAASRLGRREFLSRAALLGLSVGRASRGERGRGHSSP